MNTMFLALLCRQADRRLHPHPDDAGGAGPADTQLAAAAGGNPRPQSVSDLLPCLWQVNSFHWSIPILSILYLSPIASSFLAIFTYPP